MGLTIERATPVPLPLIAAQLERAGYEIVARGETEMNLFYRGTNGHQLNLKSDGRRVLFTFEPAADAAELERRVDSALSLPQGGAPAKRCPACSTIAEPGATRCAVCGSSL